MSWRLLLTKIGRNLELREGATEAVIRRAEATLGFTLPADLRALYLEADGIGLADEQLDLVWPLSELLETNQEFRSNADFKDLYMSFDQLLFFADDGCGNQYAIRMLPEPSDGQVYEWDHETDDRSWRARNVEDYCRRRLAKKW